MDSAALHSTIPVDFIPLLRRHGHPGPLWCSCCPHWAFCLRLLALFSKNTWPCPNYMQPSYEALEGFQALWEGQSQSGQGWIQSLEGLMHPAAACQTRHAWLAMGARRRWRSARAAGAVEHRRPNCIDCREMIRWGSWSAPAVKTQHRLPNAQILIMWPQESCIGHNFRDQSLSIFSALLELWAVGERI